MEKDMEKGALPESANVAIDANGGGQPDPAEEAARKQKYQEHRDEMYRRAKKNAENMKPPAGISLLARPLNMGYHFGVGIGLYFQMLEWLIILFSCITLLAFPFWIVINQSVFLDEANKDNPEFGFKVFRDKETNLLESTFAAIIGPRQDPNNTLVYMLTKLGDTWHGPETKDDFLLWISILDVVGVVLMILLVTYYTWRADKFEDEVDKDSYDATDYTVIVSGLPRDAGVHEVGYFFSKYGEVMDVTLVLDMEKVLQACAKAAMLYQKMELLQRQLSILPPESHGKIHARISKKEDQIIKILEEINADMDRKVARRKLRQQKKAKRKGETKNPLADGATVEEPEDSDTDTDEEAEKETEEEKAELDANKLPKATPDLKELGKEGMETEKWDGKTKKRFTKKGVYSTKAAFVTFNRTEEQQRCLQATASPGWRGWFLGHVLSDADQKMRGRTLMTSRAQAPSDYIFENVCMRREDRLWRVVGIRCLYVAMLIICALIVSGLSSQTRVDLDMTHITWSEETMAVDIARAGAAIPANTTDATSTQLRGLYEDAMQEAARRNNTQFTGYTRPLAVNANFTDFCKAALGVCASYYSRELGGTADNATLDLEWGQHFQWGKPYDRWAYEWRLIHTLDKRSLMAKPDVDPTDFQGVDIALTACGACYCSGLNDAESEEQQTGAWLALTEAHCWSYTLGEPPASGTETAIAIVIAVLNISLKLFVQYLAGQEKAWTRSEMEKSFCVVAYISQILNSVLVVLLVNARVNAKTTETGERINEDDIGGLTYIILGGSFDDFTYRWYDFVGKSFIILLIIQTIFPLINVLMEFLKSWVKRGLLHFKKEATQDAFDSAYMFPDFLLQQRIADVMMNVQVALIFCSGMPICAALVVVVFIIASLMDRYAVTSVMHVTRFDSQLPRLILALLPWAVLFHCCFGLWMHSYFMMADWDSRATSVFVDTGKEQLDPEIDPTIFFGTYTDERSVKTRIGQHNAFGLLLVAFIMAIWLVYWNTLGWFIPYFRAWVEKREKEEKGKKMKSRLRFLRKILAMQDVDVFGLKGPKEDEDGDPTFEECLALEILHSQPTYRLPFHPRYAQIFSGGVLQGAIWFKMMGPDRYTRLVPVNIVEPHIKYHVEVQTSDIKGAGTDSNVLINIFGQKKSTGKVATTGLQHLDAIGNDFEQGNLDKYDLTCRDVEVITHIEIRSCGTGIGGDWHLAWVKVTDERRGVTYEFPCNEWLTPKKPKSLVQTLTPSHVNGKELPKEEANKGIKMSKKAIADLARLEEGERGETIAGFVSAVSAAREAEKEATNESTDNNATKNKEDVEAAERPKTPKQQVVMHPRLGWKISPTLLTTVDKKADSDFSGLCKSEKLARYLQTLAASTESY